MPSVAMVPAVPILLAGCNREEIASTIRPPVGSPQSADRVAEFAGQ